MPRPMLREIARLTGAARAPPPRGFPVAPSDGRPPRRRRHRAGGSVSAARRGSSSGRSSAERVRRPPGDVLLAGLAERDVAQEQPACLDELLGTNRRPPHLAEVALDDRACACDVPRIAGVLELDHPPRLRHLERRADVIDEAATLPQVAVEARRVEGAART